MSPLKEINAIFVESNKLINFLYSSMYTPPFTISSRAIHLIADISALVERYAIRMEQEDALLLRKINRIKTIQGSLAIEGNTLSESQITDILDGKHIVAPIREIQEVRNAIKTYNSYHTFDPYSADDLLTAHKVMMEALVDNAGHFRQGGVGVFSGTQLIHMAPPADRVPYLIKDLFEWLRKSDDHLLIKSCVFHYEFEFIHPFSDGNGRIGRLWQSLILGKLHPVFEHLPVENMVFANQQAYYNAINRSTDAVNSGIFIDFMLQEIYETLKKRQGDSIVTMKATKDVGINVGIHEQKVLELLRKNNQITAKELAGLLGISLRHSERLITSLKQKGMIQRVGSNKNGYWEIIV